MESNRNSQYIVILIHGLTWILLAFAFLFYQPLNVNITLPGSFWIVMGTHLVLLVALFYINSLKMVPLYLVKGKKATFALWGGASTSVIVAVNTFLDRKLALRQFFDHFFGNHFKHKEPFNIYVLITTLLVLGISTSIAVIQHLQQEKQSNQALAQQQTTTELSLLKSQIHPHFYFNTLNNIYALTFIDAASARESLLKLSRMMRYLLYENHEKVSLSREIMFIKDYIELMKMRLLENTKVEWIEPPAMNDYPIYPMLLQTFVENAFKHGVSSTSPGVIRIRFQQIQNRFFFEVENPIVRNPQGLPEEYSGIGLANTRRRLDLLYPDKYSLTTKETDGKKHYILLEIEL